MSNDIEAERKCFEAWITEVFEEIYGVAPDFSLHDGSGKYYEDHRVSNSWIGWQARAALDAPKLMVDISPPATHRDHWMYEQGRLAERDPRSHSSAPLACPIPDFTQEQREKVPEHVWQLAEKVWRDLDRKSCPGVYMQIASESIIKHSPAAPVLSDEEKEELKIAIGNLENYGASHNAALRALLAKARP